MNKTQLRNLIEAITGHCLLNKHLSHWKEIESTKCRLCEEDDETYLHLINECPAMEYERRQIFEPPYNSGSVMGPSSETINSGSVMGPSSETINASVTQLVS